MRTKRALYCSAQSVKVGYDMARPRKIATAVRAGERQFLEAMRDRLARAIDDPDTLAKDLSPLTRRLQEVVEALAADDRRIADEKKKAKMQADTDDSFDPLNL